MAENWYYAQNNEQKGPVSGLDMLALEKAGLLQPGTLVWRSGLGSWQPWSSVSADVHAAANIDGARIDEVAVCAYSGQVMPITQMVKYGERWVAVDHKDAFIQALREGTTIQAMSGSSEPQLVGFWWRMLAFLIDWAVLLVPSFLLQLPYMFLSMSQAFSGSGGPPTNPMAQFNNMTSGTVIAMVASMVGQFLLKLVYETWLTGKYGGTVGKLALGFRVIRTDGDRVGYARALGRWGGKMLNYVIWYGPFYILAAVAAVSIWPALSSGKEPDQIPVALIAAIVLGFIWAVVGGWGFYMAGWTKRKQGLHDMVARTLVVRKNPL